MCKRSIFSIGATVCALLSAFMPTVQAQAFPAGADGTRTPRFAVISDLHFYDTSLGTTGSAFEAYLAQDRKMIRQSEAILASALQIIRAKRPDFVIIPGDLTKDGELRSHLKLSKTLRRLTAAGIKVYVCPGNHDVNNPHAFAYSGDAVTAVPGVSPSEFADIYSNFGYREAMDRDPASLSYVVEPVTGLWLFSIDTCKYENQPPKGPETSGAMKPETMGWLLRKLGDARQQGKSVVAFMHHGVTEHYTGQSVAYSDYVIDDWRDISKTLADEGLKLVFTGHFHANDITRTVRDDDGPSLLDVQTGSLVTYPSPIRMVSLHNDRAAIHTEYVTSIRFNTGRVPFPQYSRKYLRDGILAMAELSLMNDFGLTEAEAGIVAPHVADGFMAHYAGDEQMTPQTEAFIGSLLQSGDLTKTYLGMVLGSLWTDLPPADNRGLFDLAEAPQPAGPGDFDGDGDVDRNDIDLIRFHLNQPAAVNPAGDVNGDGSITMIDVRQALRLCTRKGCR